MRSIVHKLAVNTLSNISFKVFNLLLGLASVPILLSRIGDDSYGLMMLVTTISGSFSFLSVGAPAGTVKYVSEAHALGNKDEIPSLLSTSMALFVVVGVLVSIGLILLTEMGGLELFQLSTQGQGEAPVLIYVAASVAPFEWANRGLASGLEGLHRFTDRNLVDGASTAVATLVVIGLALAGVGVVGLFAAQRIVMASRTYWMMRRLSRWAEGWVFRFRDVNASHVRRILGLSVWIMVIEIAAVLFYSIDDILIGAIYSAAAIAVYRMTIQPFRLIQAGMFMLNSAMLPAASAVDSSGSALEKSRFLFFAARYSNSVLASLAVPGVFLAVPAIRLWVGEAYLAYATTAYCACIFQVIWQSNATLAPIAYGAGKASRFAVIAVCSSLLNLVLSIWWVSSFGPAGAIWATIVAGSMAVPAAYAFVLPELGVERWRYLVAVARGQFPVVVVGLCLLPFWSRFQMISTVPEFIVVGICVGTACAAAAVVGADKRHRAWMLTRIRRYAA